MVRDLDNEEWEINLKVNVEEGLTGLGDWWVVRYKDLKETGKMTLMVFGLGE